MMVHSILRSVLQKIAYDSRFRHVLYQNQRISSRRSVTNIKDNEDQGSLLESFNKSHELMISNQNKQKDTTATNDYLDKRSLVQKKYKITYDSYLGLEFYRENKLLTPLMTEVRSRKQRDKKRKIVIEGRRLISEAISCKLHMSALVFSQKDKLFAIKDEIAKAQRIYKSKLFKISQHELKMWSTLTTPPGLLAIFERPSESHIIKENLKSKTLPITVVCDNIREPNNLGSIIRTCAAIPCTQLIVTKGCCDPWESKALRGGCGGHFRLVIRDDISWSDLATWIPLECQKNYKVFIAENNVNKAFQESEGKASNYKDIGGMGAHNVVIIGGESHGVSPEAYRFLDKSEKGKCLFIPLADGIDSLNVASALTLILYEFRSQLLKC